MCVVCWLIPLFLTRNSPGPTPHSHKHTPHTHTHTRIRTQTYQKACLPLFSKSHDFIFSAICDRNQPSTNHSCSGRSLKLLFSINSVQIIYFIYTLNSFFPPQLFSVATTQNLQTFNWHFHRSAVILCSFLSAGNLLWTSTPLINIKSAALRVNRRNHPRTNQERKGSFHHSDAEMKKLTCLIYFLSFFYSSVCLSAA